MCTYPARHIWRQIMMTFLIRGGSRNAFDGDRNSGTLPENMALLCDVPWDARRLGERVTVTCSGNATRHASRVATSEVASIPLSMTRRLMDMRLLDSARLFERWWLVTIDGTLQDRGHDTPEGEARYRYVVEAKLVGPYGTMFHLMSEFMDMRDAVRDKEDCELNAFLRLTERLRAEFPRLSVCLLLDGLYPVRTVFDRCVQYGWKFIATLREGRQPSAWAEAVETMMMSPANFSQGTREGEHGTVEQTLRWTHQIPFGKHLFSVLFSGEVGPDCASLWTWVTNFEIDTSNAYGLANHGGRQRQGIENAFNVQKNGGFGLEHAFCADTLASQNYHLMMQAAHTIAQLLVNGLLLRLTQACRKLTHTKLIEMLRGSLAYVIIGAGPPLSAQIRFQSSA
jgi:hypothetical protein